MRWDGGEGEGEVVVRWDGGKQGGGGLCGNYELRGEEGGLDAGGCDLGEKERVVTEGRLGRGGGWTTGCLLGGETGGRLVGEGCVPSVAGGMV